MKTYNADGIVFGNCWGGGSCGYRATAISANTKEDLIAQAKEMLADSSLDSGMGFESLTGAVLQIIETETRTIDGKDFYHKEFDFVTIGDVSEYEHNVAMQSI